jgi:small subunit ribosomal protein S19e
MAGLKCKVVSYVLLPLRFNIRLVSPEFLVQMSISNQKTRLGLSLLPENFYKTLSEYQREKSHYKGRQTLPTPYDVPASVFIKRLAQYLKENVDQVQPPPWGITAKTSVHTQQQPEDSDWWFARSASILRKLYTKGPIGTERLRAEYGGRKKFGMRREHVRKGGGSNIRKILQQLEVAKLIENQKNMGRILTREGRRTLDRLAAQIKDELEEKTRNSRNPVEVR